MRHPGRDPRGVHGTARIPEPLLRWIEAREGHHLSHAHVPMARELGLNPRKLGKRDNDGQEPWKQNPVRGRIPPNPHDRQRD